MKKVPFIIPFLLLNSCGFPSTQEDLISIYNDKSRLYIDKLDDEESCLLKTYHHKNFGDIPYVLLDEFCDTFEKTDFKQKPTYKIEEDKFIVTGQNGGTFTFDAKKDLVTTSSDVNLMALAIRTTNNGIPNDMYKKSETLNFVRESSKTKYIDSGHERIYDCKKYNFDIVFEDGKYYAPFSLLSYIFYGNINNAYLYNGKNYFDCDCLGTTEPSGPYCYSSKGNFLLDRSGGKFGAVLFKMVDPKEKNEAYRFENIIESSKQLTVFSLLNDGTGTLKTYDDKGNLIDDGVFVKATYTLNEDKSEITIKYFSVLDMEDTEPISDISTLRINLDETNFGKQTRSKAVADFTYQELRFAMYELYGNTRNNEVKDFDKFIKDKEYKEDLLSLDAKTYDDAMAKFLLEGVDDAHTTIQYPSIYDLPTMSNANEYSVKHEGIRRKTITDTLIANQNKRKSKGLPDGGLDIVGKTAFITFDAFATNTKIKSFDSYKNTNPSDYVDSPMDLFASSFNKIKENNDVENVVVDLTCNGGGNVNGLAYLLGYFTKDPSILIHFGFNNSIYEYHYEVDLNQDGVFAGEGDTFEGKYNFYIMTSDASFSCANHLSTLCRNIGFGKVIGEKNGGGSCVISMLTNSSGYLYHSSSEWTSLLKENGKYSTNDYGVEPDIKIDSSHFYDHEYIDQLLR
ncbi:MAG: hypothetical protein IJ186_04785 [Bacilli bacterium]|nr:hypothetical protein [Bacilli bacterium]